MPAPNSSTRPFTVFNDPETTDTQPRRTKRARLDSKRLSSKSTNTNNPPDVSPIRLAPAKSTAPSLKDRLAFGNLTLTEVERLAFSNDDPRPVLLSPRMAQQIPKKERSQPSFLSSPINRALAPNNALKFPPLVLRSPFRPISKPTNSKSVTKPVLSPIRRPSENTAIHRRSLAGKDIHRKLSDSYGFGRRPRPPSFMKNLPPPANSNKLKRDPSFLDALQKPAPTTPPNCYTLRSPSILPSSEANLISPIPHVMMQIDTPSREAVQLVADMSQFSLDPKHDRMMSSPEAPSSNVNATVAIVEDEEMHFRPPSTQSSPGIEVPSQDDSWCRPIASKVSPIKPILGSSSDPLDMFHPIRFPPAPKRPVANSRVRGKRDANRSSGSSIEEPVVGMKSKKKFDTVHGKKRARKNVYFENGERYTGNDMDLSEDELLLK